MTERSLQTPIHTTLVFSIFISAFIFIQTTLVAEAGTCQQDKNSTKPSATQIEQTQAQDLSIETSHSIQIGQDTLQYKSYVGSLQMKDDEGKTSASIYYTYYTSQNKDVKKGRPLAFCFNGGPGSSSIWLHMGCLGPKRANIPDIEFPMSPVACIENPYTLLDRSDLVFIDPVETGFSKASAGVDQKQFFGIAEDAKVVAEFIQQFLTKHHRWNSPLFLIGESYGTIRAVNVASLLHDKYYVDIRGIICISPCLDFIWYMPDTANDLAYIMHLPTYAAAAHYHKTLSQEQQSKKLPELLAEVEEFALREYTQALVLGDKMEEAQKKELALKVSQYIGLKPQVILQNNLRIAPGVFSYELQREHNKIVGHFDSRYTTYNPNPEQPFSIFDPSFEAVGSGFHTAFEQYLQKDLQWKNLDQYTVLSLKANSAWVYNTNKMPPAGLGYYHCSDTLRELMCKNPHLKVLFACGYYDLVTPYFASDAVVDHLFLNQTLRQNIFQAYFDAGHMMYLNRNCLKQIKKDISEFMSESLSQKKALTE